MQGTALHGKNRLFYKKTGGYVLQNIRNTDIMTTTVQVNPVVRVLLPPLQVRGSCRSLALPLFIFWL